MLRERGATSTWVSDDEKPDPNRSMMLGKRG